MNKITNSLCLSLLLLGATALGMNPSYAKASDYAYPGHPSSPRLRRTGQARPFDITQGRLLRQIIHRRRLLLSLSKYTPDAMEDRLLNREQLIEAAKSGNSEEVERLIAQGASVDAKNNGFTPLYWAAGNGHEAVCKLLISSLHILFFSRTGCIRASLSSPNPHFAHSKLTCHFL